MYSYVLVCTRLYWYVLIGVNLFVLIGVYKRFTPSELLLYKVAVEYRYITVHTYVRTCTYQYIPVHTNTYLSVLV